MARLQMPEVADLTPEQAAVCAEVIEGPRGKVPAPMIGWLSNPELARRLQKVGELLRFDTSLGPVLTELAILVCARHWTAHVQWKAHKLHALKAGMRPEVPEAIAARREPPLQDKRERVVYDLSTELLRAGRVPDALFGEAVGLIGQRGVTEVIGIIGYYTLVSFTLNTFELGLPESLAPELNDAGYA